LIVFHFIDFLIFNFLIFQFSVFNIQFPQIGRKDIKKKSYMQARAYFIYKKVYFCAFYGEFSIFNFQFSIKICTFAS